MGSAVLAGSSKAPRGWEAGQTDDGWTAAAERWAGAGGEGRVKGMWKVPVKHPAFQHLFCTEPSGLGVFMGDHAGGPAAVPLPWYRGGHTGAGRACGQGVRAGRAAAWHGAGRSSRLQLAPGREEPDLVSCD